MFYQNLTAFKFLLLLVRDVATRACCDGHLFLAANAGLVLASIKVIEDYIRLQYITGYQLYGSSGQGHLQRELCYTTALPPPRSPSASARRILADFSCVRLMKSFLCYGGAACKKVGFFSPSLQSDAHKHRDLSAIERVTGETHCLTVRLCVGGERYFAEEVIDKRMACKPVIWGTH